MSRRLDYCPRCRWCINRQEHTNEHCEELARLHRYLFPFVQPFPLSAGEGTAVVFLEESQEQPPSTEIPQAFYDAFREEG